MNAVAKASAHIEKIKQTVNPLYKPLFHYTSEAGWINDPNGFSRYKGQYHLFAQHNPYDSKWGPMHWSHGVSNDLITWEHRPVAIAPEEDYELKLGCFSGTAIEHEGKHILMYTSCKWSEEAPIAEQEQCVAIGDGTTYEKLPQNPVMGAKHLPEFAKTSDFRDPKIIRRDGMFYALMGAQVIADRIGTMLLYKSEDLINWEYVGETYRGPKDGSMGIVFECPDLFSIGDKDIILTSPIEMDRQGYKYNNISSALYLVGKMDFETGHFELDYYDEIDTGFDYYAPQTTEDENGNRVLVAWAQMWERNFITDQLGHGWAGAMSLPRELDLKDGRLYQKPIEALKNYESDESTDVKALSQTHYRLTLDVTLEKEKAFELELLKTTAGAFKISYDTEKHELVIDRSKSHFKLDRHFREDGINNVRKLEMKEAKTLKLDIVVDSSLVEIFINDGEHTMTSNYYKGNGEVTSVLTTECEVNVRKVNLVAKA